MNTENCPIGYFRDEIAIPNPDPSAGCNGNVYIWLFFMTAVTVLRGLLAIAHFKFWFRREAKFASQRVVASRIRRLPIVPTLSFFVFLLQVLVLVLTSLNVVRGPNGSVFPLLAMFYIPTQVMHQLFALKLVRLGKKLAFRGATQRGDSSNGEKMDRLSRLDKFHKILLIICAIAFTLQKIVDILVYIVQPAPDLSLIRTGHVSAIILNIASTGQTIHQLSRVIDAVEANAFKQPLSQEHHQQQQKPSAAIANSTNYIGEPVSSTTHTNTGTATPQSKRMVHRHRHSHKVEDVVQSMKRQQRQHAIVALPLFAMYFYALITYDIPYIMFITFCFFELCASSSMIVATMVSTCLRGRRQGHRAKSSKSSVANNNINNEDVGSSSVVIRPGGENTTDHPRTMLVNKKKKTAKVSSKQALEEMEDAIRNPQHLSSALEAAKIHHCSESLMFIRALDDWLDNDAKRVDQPDFSRAILSQFIRIDSPFQIVIPETLRNELLKLRPGEKPSESLVAQVRRAAVNDVRFNPVIAQALLE